jgi:uncharacterized protein (TIGR02611 family)
VRARMGAEQTTPAPRRPRPKLVEKLEAQRERHSERSRVVRTLYAVVGLTLLLAGVAMLVTPGPAFVIIPIGLAVLSLEFRWAENLLERALEQGEVAKQKAAQTTRTQRILSAVATALAVAAVVVWAVVGDIPLLPV